MSNTSLGDRMKMYENVERRYLTKGLPLIVRVDGKAFHSFTKGFERPYDAQFRSVMWLTTLDLCENIMGCKLGYTQSDEITLLLTDDDSLETQPWFGKNLQKIVSIAASMATCYFNKRAREEAEDAPVRIAAEKKCAMFDARAFILPHKEVMNCFEWRQQDATRNAIESLGQYYFSHNQLNGKACNEIQDMLMTEHGVNFNDMPTWFKRGACVIKKPYELETPDGQKMVRPKWTVDMEIPIFHKEPKYIEDLVYHI